MNVWITVLLIGLVITAVIVTLAAICAVVLLYFSRTHGARLRKKAAEEIKKQLPDRNCGECGCGDCSGFAVSVSVIGYVPEDCPYLTEQSRESIEAYLAERASEFVAYREKVEKADASAGIVRND
jgi:Na+-translocating ferredoxin:NAD+ oxidoreductase RNF subunit RnfB